jgi:hypothetical protein
MPRLLASAAAACAAAATLAAAQPAATGLTFATLALSAFDPSSETAAPLLLNGSGVVSAGAAASFPPSLVPCSVAFVPGPGGGSFIVPSNSSTLLTLDAATGKVTATVPLSPPYQLPLLSYNPKDGLMYGIGASVQEPSAFLTLVSVDHRTGAVAALGPLLITSVLECAGALDPASGLLPFTYAGPLNLQVVAGASVSNASAGGFNAVVTNGTVLALAALPPFADGSQAVLFLSVDGLGSLWALQALDTASGNVTALVPTGSERFVNPSQGALVYDAATATAAAVAAYVAGDGTTVDVLMVFNLTGLARAGDGRLVFQGDDAAPGSRFSYTPLNDTAVAPMGVWSLAVAG